VTIAQGMVNGFTFYGTHAACHGLEARWVLVACLSFVSVLLYVHVHGLFSCALHMASEKEPGVENEGGVIKH
jgi:hypothetical protein